MGLHNEHHDFPSIPWTRLWKLHGIAEEFYAPLPSHPSWPGVTWRFITGEFAGRLYLLPRAVLTTLVLLQTRRWACGVASSAKARATPAATRAAEARAPRPTPEASRMTREPFLPFSMSLHHPCLSFLYSISLPCFFSLFLFSLRCPLRIILLCICLHSVTLLPYATRYHLFQSAAGRARRKCRVVMTQFLPQLDRVVRGGRFRLGTRIDLDAKLTSLSRKASEVHAGSENRRKWSASCRRPRVRTNRFLALPAQHFLLGQRVWSYTGPRLSALRVRPSSARSLVARRGRDLSFGSHHLDASRCRAHHRPPTPSRLPMQKHS